MSTMPEAWLIDSDSAERRPPLLHKVMRQYADWPVKPAMCGFIIRPSNAVSISQAIIEQVQPCQACLTIVLELDLARS